MNRFHPLRSASGILALVIFLSIIGLWGHRTVSVLNVPGNPSDMEHWGMADFREAVYFPVRAMLDGANPYEIENNLENYPVSPGFFVYLPNALLFNLPFGVLPYELSECLFFLLSAAAIPLLAWLVLHCVGVSATGRRVFGLGAFIAAGRPVYGTLTLGQSSLFITLGVIAALHFARSRPNIAGIGLALASAKPTFGIPLALLMLARRDFRAVTVGVTIAVLATLIPTMILAASAGGVEELVNEMLDSAVKYFQDPNHDLRDSGWMMVSGTIALVRLLGVPPVATLAPIVSFVCIGLAAFAIYRNPEPSPEISGSALSSVLISLTVLVAVHHLVYDATLVILPLIVMLISSRVPWRDLSFKGRVGAGSLLLVIWFNYLTTESGLSAAHLTASTFGWRLATSSDSAVLILMFGACLLLVFNRVETRGE